MTSKFRSVAVFVIVDIQALLHVWFLGKFIIYRYTKVHMFSSSGS
jgi:hypothetical protein